jgi:hypothetical protein
MSNKPNRLQMKKLLLAGFLACTCLIPLTAQDKPQPQKSKPIERTNMTLRPNSRDYTILRKDNNHQRMIQMRSQALVRHRQATLNRQMALEKHRSYMRHKTIRQQQIKQRMIRQRSVHH